MPSRLLAAVLVVAVAFGCGRFGGRQDGGEGGGAGGTGGGSGGGLGGGGGSGGGSGGGLGGGSGGDGGLDGGNDQLDAEEQDTSTGGGESANALVQLIVLADSLFDFDPTIDPQRTAGENAQAIEQNIRSNLGSGDGGFPVDGGLLGCGSVTLNANTVTVSFGSGCTLRNGTTASGSVAVTVAKLVNTVTLSITLTQMTVNGKSLDGTASFATQSGTGFTINADVTSGAKRCQANNFSVQGAAGTVTIDGSVSVTDGAKNYSMTFTSVTWAKGDCYPNGGTLRTVKGLVATTITFDANTPATGQVTVTTGRVTVKMYLPSYGTCGQRDGG